MQQMQLIYIENAINRLRINLFLEEKEESVSSINELVVSSVRGENGSSDGGSAFVASFFADFFANLGSSCSSNLKRR